jgi:hypothetical protein
MGLNEDARCCPSRNIYPNTNAQLMYPDNTGKMSLYSSRISTGVCLLHRTHLLSFAAYS